MMNAFGHTLVTHRTLCGYTLTNVRGGVKLSMLGHMGRRVVFMTCAVYIIL